MSWHRWGNLESLTSQRDTKLLNVSIVKVSSEPTMWSGDASFNKWQNFCLLSFHFIWCNNCNKTRSLPWSPLHVHTDSHSAPYQSVWIHSELSEEVHSILWRFNHISRLCLGATNFQSRHMLLISITATLLSFLLKCWWALVLLFRNVGSPSLSFETLCYWFLLNMTSWLLTKQNTGICFQWKHERNNLKQRHSLVLGVHWNELVPFSSHRKGSVCLLGNMSVAQRTEQKNSRTLDI